MGRAPCCEKTGLKRGPWTPEEDQKLIDYINKNGCGNWRNLPKNAGLERCGKSCRLRWTNYLRPDIKRGRFSFEEEETIIQLHSILGNKWSAIAARLPGRTDNEIKNYWNTHIRKRLLRMGIDPVTHIPRLDLLDLSSILNPQSQMNYSKLLGMQNLINPELLRLATSLFSSQLQNQDLLVQNLSTISNNSITQFSNQITPSLLQDLIPTTFDTTSYVPIGHAHDRHQLVQYEDVQQCPTNLSEFCQVNDWNQNNGGTTFSGSSEDYVPVSNYATTTSDFNFQSFLPNISSTPNSSTSTPLNSNSTNYVNSNSTTTTTTTDQDERESYSSSMMKFEILDHILDVNDFI